MSLLSDTQGSPERIYSLARGLAAQGGIMNRGDVFLWLDPQFDNPPGMRSDTQSKAVEQTIGAAVSIDCIRSTTDTIELLWVEDIETYQAFCDRVHDHLSQAPETDADYVLLDVYRWLVAKLDTDPSVLDKDAEALANLTNADRGRLVDDELRFNRTKYPAWRRWMIALGLGIDIPESPRGRFLAHATERLERELYRSNLPKDVEIPAADFLRVVLQRMPYLARENARPPAPDTPYTTSGALSQSLLELQEDAVLRLNRRADGRNPFRLGGSASNSQVFESVTLSEAQA